MLLFGLTGFELKTSEPLCQLRQNHCPKLDFVGWRLGQCAGIRSAISPFPIQNNVAVIIIQKFASNDPLGSRCSGSVVFSSFNFFIDMTMHGALK